MIIDMGRIKSPTTKGPIMSSPIMSNPKPIAPQPAWAVVDRTGNILTFNGLSGFVVYANQKLAEGRCSSRMKDTVRPVVIVDAEVWARMNKE